MKPKASVVKEQEKIVNAFAEVKNVIQKATEGFWIILIIIISCEQM